MFRVERDFSIASVDDIAHSGQPCICFLHQIDNLKDRAAGCHDILDDENPLSGMNVESAPKLHFAFLTLREDRPYLEHSSDLCANDNASDRRRDHKLNIGVLKMLGDFTAEQVKILRILQYTGTLEVLRTVESGGKSEMALEQGLCFSEYVEYLFFR